mmetsp:Transcript_20546/g.28830  ORF Transcript_20546/g.28830 Transcript_20546/m.28830 type:complete len:310 (-) Transcript_20546:33-962(-)
MDERNGEVEITEDAGPHMQILNQGHVCQEHFAKNGVQKQVHVVVKNIVFIVEIGSTVDLTKCNLEAKLVYDFDNEEDQKLEVSYVKNEPLDYKVNIHEGGYKANLEVRIKVLTSQHEDMLFRVRITATDPISQMALEIYTQPIKVISKLTQVKKKESQGVTSPQGASINIKQKRPTTPSDTSYGVSLNGIQSTLDSHTNYFKLIVHKLFVDPTIPLNAFQSNEPLQTLSNISNIITQQTLAEEIQSGHQASKDDFDSLAPRFLASLDAMSVEEKRIKIDQLLQSPHGGKLMELLDFVQASPLRKRQKTN